MSENELFEKESELMIPFFKRLPVTFKRGKGCWLYDFNGKKYLDLIAGIACVSIGHSHPEFISRVYEQMRELMHVSNLFYTEPQIRLAEKLKEISGFDKFFFCNSGTEAVEAALKIARKVTGKKKFLALENSFHGRTMGALSITWKEKFRKPFEPLIQEVEFCKFNDVDDFLGRVNADICAVILEPIQGEAGVYEVSKEFMDAVFEEKERYGYLVIFDEVQTGFCRTGEWFAKDHFGCSPDIMTMAKAMASGFPIGGVAVTNEVANKIEISEHGSTFGGNPLACTASLATIEIMQKENLAENSRDMGGYFRKRLAELGFEARGKGLLIGFDVGDAKALVSKLLEKGVVANNTSDTTIRFAPPLVITKDEIDFAVDALEECL
ncbi:acetylornithine aminotransferase apoenzyme [Archaeoglobus sulfaticallidus PM70-1]|uniref:Acetylornithine aminotransferase apoenzyme n=1 Tax=Archaeoglobus sulfaticallidus PM70-1 TaxID=387631 RepID=N0BM04_9EURY|nr:aspartate aminotransferase family protein [Archaeoglobus sulfaticallidus]AGK61606.1 acetylornithine aminotransferase apoenzyme [Archaeoglobus sulfaticallidus PM70-1]